jgi:hypothetical protein
MPNSRNRDGCESSKEIASCVNAFTHAWTYYNAGKAHLEGFVVLKE